MSEKTAEKMIKCPICGAEEDEGWSNRLELHLEYEHESKDKANMIVKLLRERESTPETESTGKPSGIDDTASQAGSRVSVERRECVDPFKEFPDFNKINNPELGGSATYVMAALDTFETKARYWREKWGPDIRKWQSFYNPNHNWQLLAEKAIEARDEAQRRLEAARQVVDDYCPEIGMTLTFRLKFYEATGFPMPEWLKDIREAAEGRAEP